MQNFDKTAQQLLNQKIGASQKMSPVQAQTDDNGVVRGIDFKSFIEVLYQAARAVGITKKNEAYLVNWAETMFEKHVRPYDIPFVPPVVEKHIDDLLKQSIPGVVRNIIEALEEDTPPEQGNTVFDARVLDEPTDEDPDETTDDPPVDTVESTDQEPLGENPAETPTFGEVK